MKTSKQQWLREWIWRADLDKLMVEAIGLHFWDVQCDGYWRTLYHQGMTPAQAEHKCTHGIRVGDRYKQPQETLSNAGFTEMVMVGWKWGQLMLQHHNPETKEVAWTTSICLANFFFWKPEKIEDTNNAQEVTT